MRRGPITINYAAGSSRNNTGERLINMVVEPSASVNAESRVIRRGRPGLARGIAAGGLGPVQGMTSFNGAVWYVQSGTLYRRGSDGTRVTMGTVIEDVACDMIVNKTQIMITFHNGTVFVYDSTVPALSQTFYSASSADYLDGFGVFAKPGSSEFAITLLNDFRSSNTLDFASAERAPDDLVAIRVSSSEAFLFGTETIEVWYNSGNADFPLERRQVTIDRGCLAQRSVQKLDNTLFWLGDDRVIYRLEGYTPLRISTHEIETSIQSIDPSNVRTAAWTIQGHAFYLFTVRGVVSFVYDAAVQQWYEFKTWGRDDFIVSHAVEAKGSVFLGGQDGAVYEMVPDNHHDEDEDATEIPLEREVISAPIHADREPFIVNAVEVRADTGRTPVPDDEAGQIMLQVQRDNRPWGNERWRDLGRGGQYDKRAVWRNLGRARTFSFRVRYTHDSPFNLIADFMSIRGSA